MKTRSEYLELLKAHVAELKEQFGVRSFRIFGSVARNESLLVMVHNLSVFECLI